MRPAILIVEDDSLSAELVQTILELEGFSTVVAASAAQAFAVLRAASPALILLDLQLPDGRGEDVLGWLSESRSRAERPPVVALTASAMLGERERLLRIGFDAYLAKPVDATDLLRTVASLLAVGRA